MKQAAKRLLSEIAGVIVMVVLVWVGLTTIAYAFRNPEKTETQVFLHISKSVILDFE